MPQIKVSLQADTESQDQCAEDDCLEQRHE